MIYLNSGSNYITLTLFEKSVGSNPYYTFKLQRKGSFETYSFTNDDLSTVPYYWNRYLINLTTTSLSATAGRVNIPGGEYTYNVYETTSQYDIGLTSSLGIVETGMCIVQGTHSNPATYNPTGATISYYGYKQT